MNELYFEQRLRADMRGLVDEAASLDLRTRVVAIPDAFPTTSQRVVDGGWRNPLINRFAPVALAAAVIGIALIIGIGALMRESPDIGPSPTDPTHDPTPLPDVRSNGWIRGLRRASGEPHFRHPGEWQVISRSG